MRKIYNLMLLILVIALSSCTSFVRFTSDDMIKAENVSSVISVSNPELPDLTEEDFNGETFTGVCSYYADKFHGKKTASGEIFDQEDFTAAHRTLPFGTKVLVTNLENNRSVIVRVNDRGPFKKNRLIDLSRAAAEELDMIKSGIVEVEIRILK
ncbi:MAG: septal ring lytic transglycosylase RlpA family protein [bacterium]